MERSESFGTSTSRRTADKAPRRRLSSPHPQSLAPPFALQCGVIVAHQRRRSGVVAAFSHCVERLPFKRRKVLSGNVSNGRSQRYNPSMDTSMLHQLPNDQKLQIIFELWDALASNHAPIELPDEVIAEAHRRCDELLADPEKAIDDEEMWRRVDG
jgi:putative addiction module component (TIGR02574 family)